jgi:hypothetical protein
MPTGGWEKTFVLCYFSEPGLYIFIFNSGIKREELIIKKVKISVL